MAMSPVSSNDQVHDLANSTKNKAYAKIMIHRRKPDLIQIERAWFSALVYTYRPQFHTDFMRDYERECWTLYGVRCVKSDPGTGIAVFYRCC